MSGRDFHMLPLLALAATVAALGVGPVDDAHAANLNLRADVGGVSITFSWNGVLDEHNHDAYYALSNPDVEIQLDSTYTYLVTDEMYGEPGDKIKWVLEARISDGSSYRVVDSESLTVTVPQNHAPTVNAGGDQTTYVGRDVTLRGHASDRNGDDIEYTWRQVSGPAVLFNDDGLLTKTAYSRTAAFQAPPAPDGTAVLVFNLTATDGVLSATDSVQVTVRPTAPEADAGPDMVVVKNTTVILDGRGSSDADGGKLTYEWVQIRGSAVEFANSTARTSFTAPDGAASLGFRLTVTDGGGLEDSDYVYVRSVDGQSPDADAGPDSTGIHGYRVYLNGSASSDPDNNSLRYKWTQVNGDEIRLSNSGSRIASFVTDRNMGELVTYTFMLTVTDSTGLADTDTVTVSMGGNYPPYVVIYGFVTIPEDYRYLHSLIRPSPDIADDNVPRGVSYKIYPGLVLDERADDVRFTWVQTGGPGARMSVSGGNVTFSTTHIQQSSLLEFNLTARDSLGLTTSEVYRLFVNVIDEPVADAGQSQEVLPGATVRLSGSAVHDPDGNELHYSWRQTAGPAVTLSSRTASSPTFTAPSSVNGNATLTFELTVSQDGRSGTDTVDIYVTEAAAMPTARAGADQNAASGSPVSLNGSASEPAAPNGNLTYQWTQQSGTRVSLSDSRTAEPSFTAPTVSSGHRTLVFKLVVTDDDGRTDSDTVSVVVGSNTVPVADAGPNQSVTERSTVRLDGSGSFDIDRDRLTYSWTQTGGTDVTLSNPASSRPTFAAPQVSAPQMLTFQLTVSDTGGNSDSDTVLILVKDAAQTRASVTADAGGDQTVAPGSTVNLDGTGSTGSTGEPLTYRWTQTGGQSVSFDADRSAPSFMAPNVTYAKLSFRLTVSLDIISDSDTVSVIVGSNSKPVVNAGDNQVTRPGSTVTLSGSATDPENDRLTYSWSQVSGRTVDIEPHRDQRRADFTAPSASGQLVFRLTATDTAGNAASDTVTVDVVSTVPIADAGPNHNVQPGKTVRLDGRGSHDPDGGSLRYSWTQTSGESVSLSSSRSAIASFRSPAVPDGPVTLVFELTVTDRSGDTSTSTVSVYVFDDRPHADAGSDLSVTDGESVWLDGGNSTISSGRISYQWTQVSGTAVDLDDAGHQVAHFVAPVRDETLVFRLTVSNGALTDSDTVSVRVDANYAPTANAGRDQTVKSGARVDLAGRASDPEGDDLFTAWSSSEPLGIVDPHSLSTHFIAPDVASTTAVTVTLEASDGDKTGSDTVTITIKPNGRPTAATDVGEYVASSGTRVTLNGTGSSDPDGDRLSYRWTLASSNCIDKNNATINNVHISSAGSAKASITAPRCDGSVSFTLEVSDGTLTDSIGVVVDISNNQRPVVNAGGNRIESSNSTITLTGTVRDSDNTYIGDCGKGCAADGVRAWWEQVSGPSVRGYNITDNLRDRTSTLTVDLPVVTQQVDIVFALKAWDGRWEVSDTVTITVNAK